MKYLKIKNLGKIEPQALTLMGASTKVNDSTKIGMFGSGNKYAISYFMRNNMDVIIYSGDEEIEITTKKETFRDEDFEIIYINGEKTSLTTKMGKDWKLWQAIREIYCNAIDEGGASIELVENIEPYELETHVYIEANDDLLNFMKEFDRYFTANKEPIAVTPYGKIFNKSSKNVNLYRKGIRCDNTMALSVYDYDFEEADINESRVLQSSYEGPERFWQIFVSLKDEKIIKNILRAMANKDNYESIKSSIATLYMNKSSQEFKNCIYRCKLAPLEYGGLCSDEEKNEYMFVPSRVYDVLLHYMDEENIASPFRSKVNNAYFTDVEMNKMQEAVMKRAMEFFKECEYNIEYDVKVVSFDSKNILGTAANNTIYVSDLAIEKGVHDLCNTIIEEQIHLKYDVDDYSREFQTAAINEMLTIMKKAYAFAM